MPKSALVAKVSNVLVEGEATFAVEARLVRELGERLVKEPEIALLELIKNSYDADATVCNLRAIDDEEIIVSDDGHGMTLDEFTNGWMRIGTSSKEKLSVSPRFARSVSGEKGIGRFAVRYLGRRLELTSIAQDPTRGFRTKLEAIFDWPQFDQYEDLGKVKIPYKVYRAGADEPLGLTLRIASLRKAARNLDLRRVRTASIELVSPYASLIRDAEEDEVRNNSKKPINVDPGFSLLVQDDAQQAEDADVASAVLSHAVLRVKIKLRGDRLAVSLWRKGDKDDKPHTKITDRFESSVGNLDADIRFYPRRKGTFTDLPLNGIRAEAWVRENSGVAVFDGRFRVFPYGRQGDDWLGLSADKARSERDPDSSLAKKHFPMTNEVRRDTSQNYMLRLPYPFQLVGAVRVRSTRSKQHSDDETGLVPSADREGFIHNKTFEELKDVVRGGVELIAFADRELQHAVEEEERSERLAKLHDESRQIIAEIEANAGLRREDKNRIIKRVEAIDRSASDEAEYTRRREQSLEVMSLLGVVAGFMTHEFGVAIDHLQKAHQLVEKLSKRQVEFQEDARKIKSSISSLEEFVTYSEGYIRGASTVPDKPYPVVPRIAQMTRIFGRYAEDRGIEIESTVDASTIAPRVPVSLYNGLVLNLFTNALKAVTARTGKGDRRIAFRAWNTGDEHFLEVSDTGVGIPNAMRKRVFDPLFSTTDANRDPLGSGMGLGLTLVKRGVEAFSGKVEVIDAPPGFATCFQVRLPLDTILK
jgi:signal transduction histidine kinase